MPLLSLKGSGLKTITSFIFNDSISLYRSLEKIRKENYDHIVVLPLFPHYASASGGSAIDKALKIMKEWWVLPKISVINQFWDNQGYINSIVELFSLRLTILNDMFPPF